MAAKLKDPDLTLDQELDLRVAEARGQLTANDERVLTFLREHVYELAFHTAESLAQGAGVSAAAVVRFSRRLGFESFRELRARARSELQPGSAEGRPVAEAAVSTLARKTQRDVASLELLPRLVEEAFAAAAAAIADAQATWFLANRETYGLAVYAQRLLHHVRAGVYLVDPAFPDALRDLGREDVVVACTFRPYARQTLELVAHARSSGARIVLVTDGLAHNFIESRDLVLAVPVDSPTLFLSFTPAVCALEALAAQVAMLDADHTHDTLNATARFVDDQRLMLEPGRVAAPRHAPHKASGDARRRSRG